MAARPVGPQYVSVDEYDVLVFPGFLRRSVRCQRAVRCLRQGAACGRLSCALRLATPAHAVHTALAPLRLRRCCRASPAGVTRPEKQGARHHWRHRALTQVAPSLPPCVPLSSQMARWNDDGSCAATARVRSGKGEPFNLTLSKAEVDEDVVALERALHLSKTHAAH